MDYDIKKQCIIRTKPFKGTPKAFEKWVEGELTRQLAEVNDCGYQRVMRCEDKKRDPDFLCLYKISSLNKYTVTQTVSFSEIDQYYFVECKRYNSCSTVEGAIKKWRSKQPKQYEAIRHLAGETKVMLALGLKDRVVLVRIFDGYYAC